MREDGSTLRRRLVKRRILFCFISFKDCIYLTCTQAERKESQKSRRWGSEEMEQIPVAEPESRTCARAGWREQVGDSPWTRVTWRLHRFKAPRLMNHKPSNRLERQPPGEPRYSRPFGQQGIDQKWHLVSRCLNDIPDNPCLSFCSASLDISLKPSRAPEKPEQSFKMSVHICKKSHLSSN